MTVTGECGQGQINAKGERTARSRYLDMLRIAGALLVIVNHTNSKLFIESSPEHVTWYLSVLWYYLSKTAVPIYVMVSGACLLPKLDSYRKSGWRAVRIALAMIIFSYAYYLWDAWDNWGLWPRAMDMGTFFSLVWQNEITNSFWYLYFYIGLMLMLPLLQRLEKNMQKRDYAYLLGLSFGLNALWPLLAHYVPSLSLPYYFSAPMFSTYIGVFFAGNYLHRFVKPGKRLALVSAVTLAVCLFLCLWLTAIEYQRVGEGEEYWFMDDRTQPSILTVASAVCVMLLCGYACRKPATPMQSRLSSGLGQCAFGIYLIQDLVIRKTRGLIYDTLAGMMPEFAAMLIWELFLFALCLGAAWVIRRIPLLRKLL